MSKVIFSIQYELSAGRKDDYLSTIRELKSLLQAEGLENYSVFEVKGKPNHFHEQYKFISDEAFEEFARHQVGFGVGCNCIPCYCLNQDVI